MQSSSSNVVKIYIPRILSNVENKTLVNTFQKKKIGKVVYIDVYKKTIRNNLKSSYKFAFLNIQLYDTQPADNFVNSIKKSPTNMFYDPSNLDNFWVVKLHLDRQNRDSINKVLHNVTKYSHSPTVKPTEIKSIPSPVLVNDDDISSTFSLRPTANIWMPSEYPEAFEHYANGLDIEYDELQREIYQMCCC